MKRIIPFILLVVGLVLYGLGRFIIVNSGFSDTLIRIGGVAVLVGLFYSTFLWRRSKVDQ